MKSFLAGMMLVAAGLAAGTLGLLVGAVAGLVAGVFVMIRSFTEPHPAGRHAMGPGQSGPGRPGYDGDVGVGEEGANEYRRSG